MAAIGPLRFGLAAALCVVLAACSGPACDNAVETDPRRLLEPEPIDREAPWGTPRMSLQEAARSGAVTYQVRGTGASSGASLTVQIRKVSGPPIDVYVTPGTIFTNSNRNAQRMVGWSIVAAISGGGQRQTTSMYLADSRVHTYLMEAYCLDIKLDNPSTSDQLRAMEVDGLAGIDVRAAQVIRVAKQRNLSLEATQGMLWMDQEDVSPQEVKQKLPTADIHELDAALETAKTMPPPKELGGGRQTVRCGPGASGAGSNWVWFLAVLGCLALLYWAAKTMYAWAGGAGPSAVEPDKAIQRFEDGDASMLPVVLNAVSAPYLHYSATRVLDERMPSWRTSGEAQAEVNRLMLEASSSQDPKRREEIALALSRFGDPRGVDSVIYLLERDGRLPGIVKGLVEFGQHAIPLLVYRLTRSEDKVRQTALEILTAMGPKWIEHSATRAAIPELIDKLHTGHAIMRGDYAEVLGLLGDRSAVPALIQALKDEEARVRRKAARSLGWLGPTEAIEPLTALLNDTSFSVRKKATEALESLRRRPA